MVPVTTSDKHVGFPHAAVADPLAGAAGVLRVGGCTIRTGDSRSVLATLPSESVCCCVTSPPYWGLRSYLPAGHEHKALEIGAERTIGEYVENLVGLFREVRRALRPDGTLWLVIGDAYASRPNGTVGHSGLEGSLAPHAQYRIATGRRKAELPAGLKHKDLIGLPWRVAFALQADGWWLREDIVWHKTAPMPESIRDRCTRAHEFVFHLSKSPTYYHDAEAIAEPATMRPQRRLTRKPAYDAPGVPPHRWGTLYERDEVGIDSPDGTRNARSVWTLNPEPYAEAHFAVMPSALAERCVKAGTSERGCCPACGAPWKRLTAKGEAVSHRGGRRSIVDVKRRQGTGGALATGVSYLRETTGWLPSCACDVFPPVPATVLDPFGGAGTVGLVCERLGRRSVLVELNPSYAEMAAGRIRRDAPLFAVAAE